MPLNSPENPDPTHLLIQELDTDDPACRREISRQLIEYGPRAVGPLIEALRTGTPAVRKSSAYLLGALKSSEALEALAEALRDEEPKVRQNAAVALGKLENQGSVSALAESIRVEHIAWVRASMLLALGAIGGEDARLSLEQITPGEDGREQESYRKAWDRVSSESHQVDWNPEGVPSLIFHAEAPEGMEFVAQTEAQAHSILLESIRPGTMGCSATTPPGELLPRLRCIYGLLIPVGEGPPLSPVDPSAHIESFAESLLGNALLPNWREWLRSDDDRIRYRFSVQGVRLRKDRLRLFLSDIRRALLPLNWTDSPSHYDLELILQSDEEASRLYVRPSFMKDRRFDYRVGDVGASIHPVVGACLARLAATERASTSAVFDPVCGSGTLLIERAMLDTDTKLTGVDISPTSVRTARANIDRAGLTDRISVSKGDSALPENWPECTEVLANLPFGLRTKHEAASLPDLYGAVVKNIAERLRPGGHAVLYTTAIKPLRTALERNEKRLKVERQFRVRSGGMGVHVYVLTPRRRA